MAYLETFWDSANDFFVQIKKSALEHVETTTILTTHGAFLTSDEYR